MKKQKMKRIISIILVIVTICTGINYTVFSSEAAAKAPTNITLNVKSKTLTVGKTYKLKVKSVKPSKASKAVTWSSSNKKIATVNNKGKVTAKKPGTVEITAASKLNKKVKAVCKIKVYAKVKKVSLNKTDVAITTGETVSLKTVIQPSTAMSNVTWKTSDKSIAVVSSKGVVTGKKAGKATVTAVSKSNKKKTAKCTVTVSDSKVTVIPTMEPTITEKPEETIFPTEIEEETVTAEPTVTVEPSKIAVPTVTATKIPIPTVVLTEAPEPISTVSPMVTVRPTMTIKPTVTVEPSKSVSPTITTVIPQVLTPTVVLSATPKLTPTISPTEKPTPTHIQRPTPTPVSTVMPEWDEGITREEWISALVEKINVSILEENMIKDEDTQEPIYAYDDIEQCNEPLKIEAAYQNQILPEEENVAGELLFHPTEKVTREFAVVTVMRALGFYDESVTLECSDKDEVTYTVEAAMAVEYGLVNLIENTFKPKELITVEESTILFQFIEEILNTRTIDENHMDVLQFADNVKNDYDNVTEYSVLDVTEDDEAVIGISLTQEIEPINAGDVIVLPPNASFEDGIIMEVHDTYVDSENNLLKITGSDPENIFDVYEKIDIEGYADPVLDEIELADGVELEGDVTEDAANQSAGEVEVTEQSINSGEQIGNAFGTLAFTYKKVVKVTCRMRGVVYDFDLDQTGINQLYYSMTNAIDVAVEGKLYDAGSESTVDLATIPFKIAPVGITLKLKVKLVPTIKGTVSVVCTVEGTEGVQYYNGQFIPIKEMSTSADLRCNVELGIGVRLDLGIYFLDEVHDIVKWFKKEDKESKPFYNIGAEAGIKVSDVTKQVYKSGVTCSDVTAYVYAELYAGTGSLLEEICTKGVFKNLNATIKWVIWDSKYSVWRKTFHREVTADGVVKIVEKCTQKSCTYSAEVYGENEEIVGDVQVTIKKANDGVVSMERNVTTDSNGKLNIDNLSPGTYEITFKKDGYDNYVTEVDFTTLQDNSFWEKVVLGEASTEELLGGPYYIGDDGYVDRETGEVFINLYSDVNGYSSNNGDYFCDTYHLYHKKNYGSDTKFRAAGFVYDVAGYNQTYILSRGWEDDGVYRVHYYKKKVGLLVISGEIGGAATEYLRNIGGYSRIYNGALYSENLYEMNNTSFLRSCFSCNFSDELALDSLDYSDWDYVATNIPVFLTYDEAKAYVLGGSAESCLNGIPIVTPEPTEADSSSINTMLEQ